MSIDTMKWVMDQEIFPSAAKFVLLCLCDHAGKKTDIAYPSIETLSRKTSQDRKTIISGLDKLCELGFLKEVGAFSSGIKHYRVIGFPDENNHYVYRVSDPKTGEFYIGARSFDGDVYSDKFIGGSRWAQEKGAENLSKEIIGVYTTRKEAELAEAYFIDLNKKTGLLKNKGLPRDSEVPKTPPVPKTVLVQKTGRGSTENGTGQYRKRDRGSTENGIGAVPKTVHRNINKPLDDPLEKGLDTHTDGTTTQTLVCDDPIKPGTAGSCCLAIRTNGIPDTNPHNPTLLALIDAGASEDEFAYATREAIKRGHKNFSYVIGIVRKQREDAAKLVLHKGRLPNKQELLEQSNRAATEGWMPPELRGVRHAN